MKKPKSIFLIIYLVFHLTLFLGAIYINYRSEDFGYLLWLRGKIPIMIYLSAAGLILYFINILIIGMSVRSRTHEKEALEKEINALKAKMFDLQETTKTTIVPEVSTHEPKSKSEYPNEDKH